MGYLGMISSKFSGANMFRDDAVEMLSLYRICLITLADRIHCEEIHRLTGTSKDVTMRMQNNVYRWFGHVNRKCCE